MKNNIKKINNKIIGGIMVALVFVIVLTLVFVNPNLLKRTTGNVNSVDETLNVELADYTEMCKYYNDALKLNLNDYSNTSKLEEALLNLDWDLTKEDQAIVDEETNDLKNAISILKKKDNKTDNSSMTASYKSNNSTTTKNKKNTTKKYSSSSSVKTTTNVEDTTTTTTTESQKVLNTVITTTKKSNEVKSSKVNWWIVPIIVLVTGIVGFVIYRKKKNM